MYKKFIFAKKNKLKRNFWTDKDQFNAVIVKQEILSQDKI